MFDQPDWIKELFADQVPQVQDVSGGGYVVQVDLKHAAPHVRRSLGQINAQRFAAASRHEPFWMKPAVGTRTEEIPVETQLLFLELTNDRIVLIVPLCNGGWRCSLEGSAEGLMVVAEAGLPQHGPPGTISAAYVAMAPRTALYELTTRAAADVAALQKTTLRENKPLPAFINDFGWCTWDAFYQEVSHDKVCEGLESFRAIGIQPRFLVLDDGWQSEENFGEDAAGRGRRLTSLSPNAKFSGDLTCTTRMAKEQFGIRTFLVWHAFQGYWSGVSLEHLSKYRPQEIPRSYSPGILHYLPEFNSKWWGAVAGIIPPTHIAGFFSDYHQILASQGVDGVKVDNQAALEAFAAIDDAGRIGLYQTYHDALEASVAKHFSTTQPLINCMSCANDLLYSYKHSALTRTSSDFYPQHDHLQGPHLWTNAFVATWFGHFIHPDWDMFHSKHPHAAFHAAARAMSGGPVYVSDKPTQHDPDLLRKLVLSDGTVLRCDGPATLTADALFTDPTREDAPLKMWNTTRNGQVGILGLFNCRHDPRDDLRITARFRPSDVPLLPAATHYAVFHHRAQTLDTMTREQQRTITLAQKECEIVTVVPIRDGVAVIGLLDKFIGSAALLEEHHATGILHLHIRDRGTLGIFTHRPPARIVAGAKTLLFRHAGNLLTVEVDTPDELRLAIHWDTTTPD